MSSSFDQINTFPITTFSRMCDAVYIFIIYSVYCHCRRRRRRRWFGCMVLYVDVLLCVYCLCCGCWCRCCRCQGNLHCRRFYSMFTHCFHLLFSSNTISTQSFPLVQHLKYLLTKCTERCYIDCSFNRFATLSLSLSVH